MNLSKAGMDFLTDFVSGIAGAIGGPVTGAVASASTTQLISYLRKRNQAKKSELQSICGDMIPEKYQDQKEMILSAAEICMAHLEDFTDQLRAGKLDETSFDWREKAKRWAQDYVGNDPELEAISPILTAVLEVAIKEYMKAPLRDGDTILELARYLAETLADHEIRIGKMEKNVRALQEEHCGSAPAVRNAAEDYRSAWTRQMFLHPGRAYAAMTLSKVYQVPPYSEYQAGEWVSRDTDHNANGDQEPLQKRLQEFLDSGNNPYERMLLVLGQPGSGKTTLITYLLNQFSIDRTVLVYPLRELGIDWSRTPNSIPDQILRKIRPQGDLNNCILILDGLDEVDCSKHTEFLNQLYIQWAQSRKFENFNLLITCRQSRISTKKLNDLSCACFLLENLTTPQIKQFIISYYEACNGEPHHTLSLDNENAAPVLGIPIILYMVLATGINIGQSTTIVDIYQKLFSLNDRKHSIYFRPQENLSVDDTLANRIHEFSKQAAVSMWEHHPEEAILEHERCKRIVETLPNGSSLNLHDLMTGQYFIEGTDGASICFVHRSIYEYFVALSITDAIRKLYDSGLTPEQLFSDEHLDRLGRFADLIGIHSLNTHNTNKEILTNIIYLLGHLYQSLDEFCNWWKDFFVTFLPLGLADATSRHKGGPVGITEESQRCMNILQLSITLHQALAYIGPYPLIPDKTSLQALCRYQNAPVPHARWRDISMQKLDFSEIQLDNAILSNSHLSDADLTYASLSGSELIEADLKGAYLMCADLMCADLSGADLSGADLSSATLGGANLTNTSLVGTDLSDASLVGADLTFANLTGAILRDTELLGADLRRAVLRESDLTGADLREADLSNADLSSAILKDTRLPDGFQSNDQDEQIAHLKSLNIEGLKI